jgi:cyclophilin family peptidyl-prolyl cis-trans isomerase
MDHHHSTTSSSSSSSQPHNLLYHPHHVTIASNVTGNPTMTSLTNTSIPAELEDLILCSCCHGMFNDTDAQPKMFACRHYFCLKCVNSLLLSNNNNNNNNNNNSSGKNSALDGESNNNNNNNNPNGQYELYCVHCWKRTELSKPGMKPTDLPTYNAILYLTKHLSLFGASSAPLPPTKLDLSEKSNLYQQSNHSNSTNNTSNNSSNNNVRGSLDLNNLIGGGGSNKAAGDVTKKQPHENCLTHAMPFSLWCMQCNLLLCRACAGSDDHRKHVVKAQAEARELLYTDTLADVFLMQKYFSELQHFVLKQKEFLLKVLESCTMLKTQIEMELTNHGPTYEISDIKDVILKAKTTVHQMGQSPEDAYTVYAAVNLEKQRLQVKHHDMLFQCKMDDIIRNYRILFDFDLIKKILTCLSADSKNFNTGLDTLLGDGSGGGHQNYFLMLANYCVSQLYTRHVISMRNKQMFEATATTSSLTASTTFPQPPPTGAQQYEAAAAVAASNDFLTSKFFEQQQHSMNDTITSYIYTTPITASTSLLNPPPSYAQLDLIDTSPSDDKHCKIIQNNIIKAVTSAAAAAAANQKLMNNNNNNATNIPPPPLAQQPSNHLYPIYFFNIEMNGIAFGRVLIEVRNDVAPKMAKNFDALCTGEHGFGYKGCTIFQCWENESIITGDFELNNGRGGRSIYEESYFMPDDTKILAIRGSVGMRRSQKRHDNMGLVGSQFRIILREMRGFTGIFAFVIEGLDLVEKISQSGDSTGKPQNNIVIVNCGKLH